MSNTLRERCLDPLVLWARTDAAHALHACRLLLGGHVRTAGAHGRVHLFGAALLRMIGGGASSLIAVLLGLLGRYRTLDARERADAHLVFGQGIDLDRVRVAKPGGLHRLLFVAQRLLQGGGPPRAFVTGNLIHVAPGHTLTRALLIHELTHVWQAQVDGPCCLWQALHAQFFGEGYDYGADLRRGDSAYAASAGDTLGEGAQATLRAKPFAAFNREQQAQILMHYFVRRVLLQQSPQQLAPWEVHAVTVRGTLRPIRDEGAATPAPHRRRSHLR
ncbi:MAG: hypothetical protein KIS79_05440 [Burkholderiales bacterium]|nr:hypothetical protein [Burkholderiales bacterium]